MEAIFSSSALQTRQREIKDIARQQIVHITENGNGAFVFCSEELLQKTIDEACAAAVSDALLAAAVEILYTRVLYCIQSDIYNFVCYN